MKYMKIKWIHNSKDFPLDLYSEIGDDGYEVRKVDIFSDGSYGYADKKIHTQNTDLGDKITPSIEEINTNSEFKGIEITKEEFENIWEKALNH